jgi:hypothetical protein
MSGVAGTSVIDSPHAVMEGGLPSIANLVELIHPPLRIVAATQYGASKRR